MIKNKAFILVLSLILFISISGVCASNASDVSNNPNLCSNINQISDLTNSTSQVSNNIETSQDVASNSSTNGNIANSANTTTSDNNLDSSNSKVVLQSSQSMLSQTNNNVILGDTYLSTTTTMNCSGNTAYKGDNFIVSLLDGNNNGISGQTIALDFKFGSNNKTYFLTTNSNGEVSIPINLAPNTYTVTYSYSGSTNYSASSNSVDLTVINGIYTIINLLNNTVPKGNSLTVSLTDINGNPLSNRQVNVIFGKGTQYTNPYTITTNSEGKANIQVNLALGSYDVYYTYNGDNTYRNVSGSSPISVVTPTVSKTNTIINGKNLTVYTNYENILYNITLLDASGNPVSDKNIFVSINGLSFEIVTNEKGVASLYLPNGYSAGTYSITYNFKGDSTYNSCQGTNSFIVNNYNTNKTDTVLTADNISMIQNDGTNVSVILTDINGKVLIGQHICITFSVGTNSKDYYATTDNAGKATLPIGLTKGEYTVKYSFTGNSNYNPSSVVIDLTISAPKTPTLIQSSNLTMYQGSGQSYTLTLIDIYGNTIANKEMLIVFTKASGQKFNYTYTTDENGIINIPIGLAVGTYTIQGFYSGDSVYSACNGDIQNIIVNPQPVSSDISINQIISGAISIRDYVLANSLLPDSITLNDKTYTIGDFAYYVAQAIVNINSGNTNSVTLKDVTAAPNPNGDYINGKYDMDKLVNVAIKVVTFVNNHGYDPNYVGTSLGQMSFDDYTYAMVKALIFYSENGRFPNFVSVVSSSVNGGTSSDLPTNQFVSGLNERNNGADASAYYANSTSWKCNSQSSAIISLANSLTSSLTTQADKATAIFNYVRDDISYSYYSNSVRGASGTLSAGKGNCVDQASLVIALCRAAGLAARYCHGQGCTFSSGLVTGHVWAQILIGDTWYSADATSVRNSLGHVVNWNVYSFSDLHKYVVVPF